MVDWDENSRVERREATPRSGGLRHDVAVPALLETGRDGVIDAEIVDLSATGMYLRLSTFIDQGDVDTLALGTVATITFAPDHANAPDETVSIAAEVVRRNPHGVGLRFVDVNRAQRRGLRTLALMAVESRAASSARAAGAGPKRGLKLDGRVIMSACLKVIERRLPNLVWVMRTEVVKQLRAMSVSEPGQAGQEARADADRIEEKGTAIGRTIERRVIKAFAEVGGLEETQKILLAQIRKARTGKGHAPTGETRLVQEKVLEKSVAMNTTCQRLDTALSGRAFDVNVRLANVLGRRIDEVENPLLPAVMGRMLWQSVTEYRDSPRVRRCLYATIVRHVLPLLVEIYDQIDATLDARGVPDSYWSAGDG